LVSGTVEMDHKFALSAADVEAGYVLTCQSHPTGPTVAVDYDA
jgi:ring-1,2-phenylacetyl-CoA epoxidase subunit PaaE